LIEQLKNKKMSSFDCK